MDVTDFNNNLRKNLLKKINQEQKIVFLRDFNVDLMHYHEHKPRNEFLDSLASDSYLPYIIQPSRNTSLSKTLINIIFSNVISKYIICCNITTIISDHLPQFLLSPNTFTDPPSNLSNILLVKIWPRKFYLGLLWYRLVQSFKLEWKIWWRNNK